MKRKELSDQRFRVGYIMNALKFSEHYPCCIYVDNHTAVKDSGIS